MNKKGFTVTEVLAVIAVIAIIGAIAIPSIIGIQKNMNAKAYENKKQLIQKAAVLYAQESRNEIKESLGECNETKGYCHCENGSCEYIFSIQLDDLIAKGYYEVEKNNTTCKVSNPTDKSDCLETKYIEITMDFEKRSASAIFPKKEVEPNGAACFIDAIGPKGTNGWYVGDVTLKLHYGKKNVTAYGIDMSITPTYNSDSLTISRSIPDTKYYGYVKYIEPSGEEVIATCETNIKIDKNVPLEPTISYNSSYDLVIGNSSNPVDTDYYYSENCDTYSKGIIINRYTSNQNNRRVCAYAQDQAGNRSKVVESKVNVVSALSTAPTPNHSCSHLGSGYYFNISTSRCEKTTSSSTRDYYTCSLNPSEKYYSGKPACTSTSIGELYYKCPDGNNQKSSTCEAPNIVTSKSYNYKCNSTYAWSAKELVSSYITKCSAGGTNGWDGWGCDQGNQNVGNYKETCEWVDSKDNYETVYYYKYRAYCQAVDGNGNLISAGAKWKQLSDSVYKGRSTALNAAKCTTGKMYDKEAVYQYSKDEYDSTTNYYNKYKQTCTLTKQYVKDGTGTCVQGNCNNDNTPCPSGYTKTGQPSVDNCPKAGETCTSNVNGCTITWSATCTAIGTKEYLCPDGKYYSNRTCTTTGSVGSETENYCPTGTGSCKDDSCSSCLSTGSSRVSSYTCSLTGTTYTDYTSAQRDCTNYCPSGDLYGNKCYSIS